MKYEHVIKKMNESDMISLQRRLFTMAMREYIPYFCDAYASVPAPPATAPPATAPTALLPQRRRKLLIRLPSE